MITRRRIRSKERTPTAPDKGVLACVTAMSRGALLLDCDGVIVDSEPANFAAWDDAFFEVLGRRSDAGPRGAAGLGIDACFALWGCGAETLPADVRAGIIRRKHERYAEKPLPLVPGIEALIDRARGAGWAIAIVSGASPGRLAMNLRAAATLGPRVDLTLDGGTTGAKSWAVAAERLGVPVGRCVALDDTMPGVASARAQGIGRIIGVTTTFGAALLRAAGADATVARPDEVELEPERS